MSRFLRKGPESPTAAAPIWKHFHAHPCITNSTFVLILRCNLLPTVASHAGGLAIARPRDRWGVRACSHVLDLAFLARALELLRDAVDGAVQLAYLVVQHLAGHLWRREVEDAAKHGVREREGMVQTLETKGKQPRGGGARDVLVVLTSRFSFPSPKSFFILSLFRRALETWGAKRKPRTPKTVPPTRTPDQKPPEPSPLLLDACKVFPLSATSFLCLRTASEPESGRAEREGLEVADAAPRLRAAPPLSPVLDDGAVLAC